ncbi:MAG: NAD(P)-dependent oxidoreductase [Bacteroidetes bacterium]|nr:NAD(P)-dependent oxidoreductase [Bacteroidota bacterium]
MLIANYQTYFDCIVFRPFFIYGKRQKKDMLIPRLVENINQGNEIKLEGEHGLRINPIHVQDASDAILQSFDLNGSYTINLGGDEVLSLKQICEIIAQKMDKKTNFTHLEKIPNDVYGDIALLKKLIGAPRHRFEQGIDELLN